MLAYRRMMLKVWLYAYRPGVHSTRRLERRIQEDLAFRYLALRRCPAHARAINDLFTQTMEMARRAEVVRLGHVAIDSTRVQANASRGGGRGAGAAGAASERQVRRFQRIPDEGAGTELAVVQPAVRIGLRHLPPVSRLGQLLQPLVRCRQLLFQDLRLHHRQLRPRAFVRIRR